MDSVGLRRQGDVEAVIHEEEGPVAMDHLRQLDRERENPARWRHLVPELYRWRSRLHRTSDPVLQLGVRNPAPVRDHDEP